MKNISAIGLLVVIGLLIAAPKVMASEGVIKLDAVNNSGSSCYALSIYTDNRYEVEGACRGLIVPFSAEQTYYILWSGEANSADQPISWKRQTEIERGKFSAIVADKFQFLQVTAESDWSARKPSSSVVAKGQVENLPITGAEVQAKSTTNSESKIDVYKPAATPAPTVTPTTTKVASGSLFGAILRVVGTGLLILIGIVVVMSIITRRKGF